MPNKKPKGVVKDHAFYVTNGRKGGIANRDKQLALNPDHFSEIGTAGGAAHKAKYGLEFYSRIGKMKPGAGKNPRGVSK